MLFLQYSFPSTQFVGYKPVQLVPLFTCCFFTVFLPIYPVCGVQAGTAGSVVYMLFLQYSFPSTQFVGYKPVQLVPLFTCCFYSIPSHLPSLWGTSRYSYVRCLHVVFTVLLPIYPVCGVQAGTASSVVYMLFLQYSFPSTQFVGYKPVQLVPLFTCCFYSIHSHLPSLWDTSRYS